MRRLLTSAAIATALLIPASVATVGLAGTANAAGSSIACSSLKGTISTTVTIGKCTPKPTSKATAKLYKSATGASSSLAAGGNITWNGGAVTTIGDASVGGGTSQGSCKAKNTEYTFSGTVTAESGASGVGIPAVGDAVSASACVSTKGKISLVPGSTMKL